MEASGLYSSVFKSVTIGGEGSLDSSSESVAVEVSVARGAWDYRRYSSLASILTKRRFLGCAGGGIIWTDDESETSTVFWYLTASGLMPNC